MNGKRQIWLLACVGLLGSCGGGGGGGNGGLGPGIPEQPPTILPTYNFEIGGIQPGTDMGIDVGGQLQVGIDLGESLHGSVNLQVISPNDVIFVDFVTDAGSTMTVTATEIGGDLDGELTLNIVSDIVAGLGEEPASGAFEVVTAEDTTSVTFVANGVELSLNGAAAMFFSWEDYENLVDDNQAATWLRRASMAGGALDFVFERVFEIADLLDSLELTQSAVPIVTSCDEFQGAPPAGVLLQGEHVFTRFGSAEDLSPGDVFDWTFTNCWFASSNTLIDNFLQMQNYIEVIDASNTLTRIGFGPDNNMSGGVLYFDWRISETQENQGVYTILPEDRIEVNGGFTMIFTRP